MSPLSPLSDTAVTAAADQAVALAKFLHFPLNLPFRSATAQAWADAVHAARTADERAAVIAAWGELRDEFNEAADDVDSVKAANLVRQVDAAASVLAAAWSLPFDYPPLSDWPNGEGVPAPGPAVRGAQAPPEDLIAPLGAGVIPPPPAPARAGLPLALAAVAPGPTFRPLPLPPSEGLHTGGVWVEPGTGSIWKPLDALPYPNAPGRVPTAEADALAAVADHPLFPRNWRVAQQAGRAWLVRPRLQVVPDDMPATALAPPQLAVIEAGLRLLNARGWTVGDALRVALDPATGGPVLLDLSNTHQTAEPDDEWRWWAYLERLATPAAAALHQLRRLAKHLVRRAAWDGGEHVYTARLLPVALPPDARLLPMGAAAVPPRCDLPDRAAWVVAPRPLAADEAAAAGLTWAWSPLPYVPA